MDDTIDDTTEATTGGNDGGIQGTIGVIWKAHGICLATAICVPKSP